MNPTQNMDTPGRSHLDGLHRNILVIETLLQHWQEVEQQAGDSGDNDLLNYALFKWRETQKAWHALQQQLREYNKYHS